MVLGLVVTRWITEAIPIPITGVVGLCLCVILNVASADDVFGSVADSTIFLFIGSFIAEAMLVHGLDRPERLRFGAALMLVITYGITVGGLLLPIGSPPNLIGRALIEEETGEPITFFEWFLTALPIVLVMFVALLVVILWLNRPEVKAPASPLGR